MRPGLRVGQEAAHTSITANVIIVIMMQKGPNRAALMERVIAPIRIKAAVANIGRIAAIVLSMRASSIGSFEGRRMELYWGGIFFSASLLKYT